MAVLAKISSRSDLQKFVQQDLKARGLVKLPWFYRYRKPIIYYTVTLRRVEYLRNCKNGFINKCVLKFMQLKLKRMGMKLGFSISPNTVGPGLYLVHWGSVVISSEAQIGANARVHSCVNISRAPVIGNNAYFGPGSVVVGNIIIGDNVSIGANSVVTTSLDDNVTVLGNPARVVKVQNPISELQ
jgi:serine O-acetyltransferase